MAHLTRSFGSIDLTTKKFDTLTINQRRPVPVTLTRIYFRSHTQSTDINNNQARILLHPANTVAMNGPNTSQFELPPVSTAVAIIQIFAYFMGENLLNIKDEKDISVSWQKVVVERQTWRLFVAQFFHFGQVHIFFNVVTLMAMGRFLEKKIRPFPYALLILFMSAMSNLFYIFLSDVLCSGPNNDFTVGFTTVMFSLRMIHIFTMDSDANNGKGDPNLIFGFLPVYLPPYIAPWQPVLETIFFDVFIIKRCVANNVAGMCAGLAFPYLMKNYRHYIMYPKYPPPPPPKYRARFDEGKDTNTNPDD